MPQFGIASSQDIDYARLVDSVEAARADVQKEIAPKRIVASGTERVFNRRMRDNDARWARVEADWNAVPASAKKSATSLEKAAFIGASIKDWKVVQVASVEDKPKARKIDSRIGRNYAAITERDGTVYFVEIDSARTDAGWIVGIRVDGYGSAYVDKVNGTGQRLSFDRADVASVVPLHKSAGHPLLRY